MKGSSRSGIYRIINNVNGKFYIGSAKDFHIRYKIHYNSLKINNHHSKYLQRAWNKYGEESFTFEILEIVEDKTKLIEREQYYLDNLLCEYNICKVAGSPLGVKRSEKTKKLQSDLRKGKSPSNKGISPSLETRLKISKKLSGRKLTDEHRNNISIGNTGRIFTEETRRKIGEKQIGEKNHNYGKKMLDETKNKISNKMRGKKPKNYDLFLLNNKKRAKPILQYDLNGNFIREWSSALEASKFYNKINGSHITSCCKGKINNAYGYNWKYKE